MANAGLVSKPRRKRRVKTDIEIPGTGGLVLQLNKLEVPKDLRVKGEGKPSLLEAFRLLLEDGYRKRKWIEDEEGLKRRKKKDSFE